MIMTNEEWMKKTFDLARLGLGFTWPNPLVGAIFVKNGKIIGEGFHHQYGQDHAEIDALKNCSESPEGSTLYVNLEPCCHTKKQTPPCAQRLITEKIKKVVISNLDPNPEVNGKGVELLRAAGIEVEHGISKEKGEELNEAFFFAQRNKAPFIHLKMASTLDGRIALPNGESQWITGLIARNHVHELRAQHQGVMIGAETLRKDNPKLNVRIQTYVGRQPFRIVFTKSGVLPQEALLFNDDLKHQTIVYTETDTKLHFPTSQIIKVASLEEAMKDLYQKNFMNLLLEGGSSLASAFMSRNLVNRVSVYLNPSFLGSGPTAVGNFGLDRLEERPRLKNVQHMKLGEDFYFTGRLN
jgi:diaminohydroxyphosphoribosylaminopyrimidine deaminase/5-amino-6-(5-phosphoribosylamino)uracil reductase